MIALGICNCKGSKSDVHLIILFIWLPCTCISPIHVTFQLHIHHSPNSSSWEPPVTSSRHDTRTRMSSRVDSGRLPTTIPRSCRRASTSPSPSRRPKYAVCSTSGTTPSTPWIPMPSPSDTPRRVSCCLLLATFPVPTTVPSKIIS